MRGRLDPAREQGLFAFWERQAGFGGEVASQRLPEVVCVLSHDGEVAGASSAFPAAVDLVGGRRFWVFRSLLDERHKAHRPALIRATFEALDAEHQTDRDEPVGLCLLQADEERRASSPEAEWRDPQMIYVGYLRDGRQVRIAYFSSEVSGVATGEPEHGWTPAGYRIEALDQQTAIGSDEIIEMWVAEAGLSRTEAERRASEVFLIASDPDGSLAGLCTAYLARNEQLRAEMWHYRTFVRAAHRKSNLAVAMLIAARDHLIERHVGGRDSRGLGIVFELEHEGLKRHLPKGLWRESDFLFIGENARGDHVRVHYFPGAVAPEPGVPPVAQY